MRIQEIFAAEVTRDIAPVIYFHEQDPGKVLEEVSEYIITGGYPESDPRHRRIPTGIHEQFVTLLRALAAALRKQPGTDLPAAWIGSSSRAMAPISKTTAIGSIWSRMACQASRNSWALRESSRASRTSASVR